MTDKKEKRDFWEVRRGKEVLCCGTVPFFGYPPQLLRDMYADGLCLYKNGNRVKKCELTLV